MTGQDEAVEKLSDVTEEECEIVSENMELLKRYGASTVVVKNLDDKPNEIQIWGPSQSKVEQAVSKYTDLVE
jgi:hypothetical protein